MSGQIAHSVTSQSDAVSASRAPRLRYAVAAALGSALLCRLTCPPFDLAPLAFIAFVPLLLAIRGHSAWTSAAIGFAHGVCTNLMAFHWLAAPLHDVAGFARSVAGCLTFGLCAWQATRAALLTSLWHFAAPRSAWLGCAVFGAGLLVTESLFPMVFPYGSYGLLHAAPIWSQLAYFGGAGLVSLVIGGINQGFVAALTSRRPLALLIPLGAVGLLTLQGALRMRALDREIQTAEPTRVLVVQGGLRPAALETRDPTKVYRTLTLAALQNGGTAQWAVWPETAIFYPTRPEAVERLFRNVLLHDRGAGAAAPAISIPVATGIVLSDKRAGLSRDVNSFVLGDSSGRVLGRYDKQRLVPLGESSSAALGAISGSLGGFVPGDDSPGLSLGPRRIATVLCFEALDSELVRRAMQHGTANLLLNPSSDAWFADSPGPSLHLALAKIRAIEHARYLLRPTTNGISALVDPAGRVVWSLPPDRAATGVATAHWLSSVTPFTLIDATWPMYIASLLCGIAVMSRLRRGRAWFRRNAGPV